MRFIHTKKRSRSQFGNNGRTRLFKRRRLLRSRRFRRRSATTITNRGLFGQNPFKIRARKLKRSAYRRALYNETRFKQHYKTIAATASVVSTPVGTVTETFFMVPVFTEASLLTFWHTAGGLQDPGFGSVPSWAGATDANDPLTITIRGGRIWLSANARIDGVDSSRIRIQLIWPKQQQRSVTDGSNSTALGFPGTATGYLGSAGINPSTDGFVGTSRPVSWSFQDAPDYAEYFYPPVLDKSFDMKTTDTCEVYWKIKPIKIDTDSFKRGSGWYPWWCVYMSQTGDRDTNVEPFNITRGFNMSFSATDTLT